MVVRKMLVQLNCILKWYDINIYTFGNSFTSWNIMTYMTYKARYTWNIPFTYIWIAIILVLKDKFHTCNQGNIPIFNWTKYKEGSMKGEPIIVNEHITNKDWTR